MKTSTGPTLSLLFSLVLTACSDPNPNRPTPTSSDASSETVVEASPCPADRYCGSGWSFSPSSPTVLDANPAPHERVVFGDSSEVMVGPYEGDLTTYRRTLVGEDGDGGLAHAWGWSFTFEDVMFAGHPALYVHMTAPDTGAVSHRWITVVDGRSHMLTFPDAVAPSLRTSTMKSFTIEAP